MLLLYIDPQIASILVYLYSIQWSPYSIAKTIVINLKIFHINKFCLTQGIQKYFYYENKPPIYAIKLCLNVIGC